MTVLMDMNFLSTKIGLQKILAAVKFKDMSAKVNYFANCAFQAALDSIYSRLIFSSDSQMYILIDRVFFLLT